MDHVVFPQRATVQLKTAASAGDAPLPLAGVLFLVRVFARRRNDYLLAPFVSDATGLMTITREACDSFVRADHESGLMDYSGIDQCLPEVEIRHLSQDEIRKAAKSRRTHWQELLPGEDRLFRSMDELLALYDGAPNGRLGSAAHALRPCWDGSDPYPHYEYVVSNVAPT